MRALFGDSLVIDLVAQSFVDAITCVLTAALAGLLSIRLALPNGMLAAFWPNLIVHSGAILSDAGGEWAFH